jgi:hypothetical protein
MGEVLCPYCKAALKDSAIVRCLQCSTEHHSVCWLEYGNRCSVFSCQPAQLVIRKIPAESAVMMVLWCVMNYALHLSLGFIGEWTSWIQVSDVFIVALLEGIVIGTGWFLFQRWRTSEPARTAGILLFSGNALFVSFLLSHFIAHGFDRLNALIRL